MRPSAAQLPHFSRLVVAILGAAMLSACGSSPGLPEPESGPYTGPAIRADTLASEHILVATLPAPGFEFTLDGTREAFRSQDVFVSLRRPNPAVLYPQVVVDLRLSTGIPVRTPVRVFARTVEYTDREGPAHREALLIPALTSEPARVGKPFASEK